MGAVRWGSAEEIWLRFGITERAYFLRLHRVLMGQPLPGLDSAMWERLRSMCAQRLAVPDTPPDEWSARTS